MRGPGRVVDPSRARSVHPSTDRGATGALVPVLVGLTVLLLVAAVTLALMARSSVSAQERRLAELRTQQAADAREAGSGAAERPAPDRSAMQRQLDAIRTADRAVDTVATTWRQGGSQLKIVWQAVGRCMALVDAYDRSAGAFTEAELNGLPAVVDLRAAATDCGADTLRKNAKGAGF